MTTSTRRRFFQTGATILTVGTFAPGALAAEQEVEAVEDLMREHGILRRALLVYQESAGKLRSNPASVDGAALNRTAKLFQIFGEDYHERKLEEAHIFPRVKKAGGLAGGYVDVLTDQHNRGREITQFIIAVTKFGRVSTANAHPLASAFEAFVRMYENHAAREDTIVFPAWKNLLSESDLEAIGESFEDIENRQFGGDGFEKAAQEIGNVERLLGLANIAQFTAPEPPRPT